MEIEEKVKALIADRLCVDEILVTQEASLRGDLGADSMDMAELAMQVEMAFDINIHDQDGDDMRTVADVVRIVTAKKSN